MDGRVCWLSGPACLPGWLAGWLDGWLACLPAAPPLPQRAADLLQPPALPSHLTNTPRPPPHPTPSPAGTVGFTGGAIATEVAQNILLERVRATDNYSSSMAGGFLVWGSNMTVIDSDVSNVCGCLCGECVGGRCAVVWAGVAAMCMRACNVCVCLRGGGGCHVHACLCMCGQRRRLGSGDRLPLPARQPTSRGWSCCAISAIPPPLPPRPPPLPRPPPHSPPPPARRTPRPCLAAP